MSRRLDDLRNTFDSVTIPGIWVALLLSLILHALLLWGWHLEQVRLQGPPSASALNAHLEVRLAQPPSAPAQQVEPTPPPVARRPPSPRAPPVIALERNAPGLPAGPTVAAPPPQRSTAVDLDSHVEERRRARGQSPRPAPPVDEDKARRERIVAANLGTNRAPTFGDDPTKGGGMFQIQHVYFDRADFTFYGWNKDIRRETSQLVEVKKGDNSDIKIAVVRKMIAIIREQEKGDFEWISRKRSRPMTLSADPAHNEGLEYFLMREMFED